MNHNTVAFLVMYWAYARFLHPFAQCSLNFLHFFMKNEALWATGDFFFSAARYFAVSWAGEVCSSPNAHRGAVKFARHVAMQTVDASM